MQKSSPIEDLSAYKIRRRFTILQLMAGLALLGIIATVLLKMF